MRAMVLEKVGHPLQLQEYPMPHPSDGELLVKVEACGVCRTDVHIAEGELTSAKLPLIPGHQVVGRVAAIGNDVTKYRLGERVGIPWLGGCCDRCDYCIAGRENLCDHAIFTGYVRDGGYAEYCTVHQEFAVSLPEGDDSLHMAPLLCAGLIGYRAFRLCGTVKNIGIYGFGSAAHLLIQVVNALGVEVYVFTRSGDREAQRFAYDLEAKWAGGSDQLPPKKLDAALIFAPVGALYLEALKAVKKGGKVISAGIHMSDIPSFPYALLWGERSISSVANLTRRDATDYIKLIGQIPIKASIEIYPLERANDALTAIKQGSLEGSAVLQIS